MTVRRSDYAVVSLKSLNGIAEHITTARGVAVNEAKRSANKHNQVMVVIKVVHVFVPELTPCEEEGCKSPAVLHYCEEHAQ